ncbi:MAG: hypothetical protein RL732_877, partial [Bacteroidota bacterium]
MIGFFNRQSTANVGLLAIYALVLKFRLFLSPLPPVLSDADSLIYRSLIRFLDLLH